MIVEFIGTPGAGKTTLLPTVMESLQEQGFKALTYLDAARPYANRTLLGQVVSCLAPQSLQQPLLWRVFFYFSMLYRLKFLVNHPKLIWLVLSSQRYRPKSADIKQRNVLKWFFHLVGYYEFLKAYAQPNEVLIFVEGFVHRVVQLNASGVEEPNLAQILAYVDLLPQPDLVIHPQAPHNVCEKRLYSRGIWERFRHKDRAEISQFVANSHEIVNLTVDYIKSKGWTVIEVDNGNDLMTSNIELRGKLAKIIPAFASGLKLQTAS
jgi:thymidylate kinase